MHILHVVARSHMRGAERAAVELTEELDALGHENRVVALGLSHARDRDAALRPLVSSASEGLLTLGLAAWRLRRLVRDEPCDVVMAHGGWPAQVTALALPRHGPLLVWQRILGFPPGVWSSTRRRWWRAIVGRVDAAVALTAELAGELRQLGFMGPIWVIPNARRPERFSGLDRELESRTLRRALGLPGDIPLLGFVGHLVDQKRADRTIRVLADVRRRGVPAHLVIAGEGPRRAQLERLAKELRLEGHVSFLGHRTDVERVFAAVDLCLLTSDAEGIPGVAIEAQMAGTPVVTFPLGGVAEVVEHGVTGIILERPATADMAEAAVALLGDPERRRAMGDAARSRTPLFAASRTAMIYAEQLIALDGGVARDPG